jgi:hypothetical protein
MNNQIELLNKFYSGFQKKDVKSMIECYHPEIHFKDEVFDLKGKQAGAMWHMLCESGKDLQISFRNIKTHKKSGSAYLEAKYTFSKTKRTVHNKIIAHFEFKDGKIIRHIDAFNFWKWSWQAFGILGLFLGWTSFLRKKISTAANTSLKKFIEKHPIY